MFLHNVQFVISINLESVFFLWFIVFWTIKAVNNTAMFLKIWVVDTPWTCIFRMRLGACSCWFCVQRLPIFHEWMSATILNTNHPRGKATNRWCSIDAHSQHEVVTLSLSLLPIKPANTSVMHKSYPITVQLPHLHDHKSLTHCWQAFSEWGSDRDTTGCVDQGCHSVDYA